MKSAQPLLMIAEDRRPRSRKAPKVRPREIVLHMAVVDALRKLGNPTWRWSHFLAGEARDARTGAKLKRMGTKPGWPDIMLLSPADLFHGLELKRGSFMFSSVRNGVRYVRTLVEALATLGDWGATQPIAKA